MNQLTALEIHYIIFTYAHDYVHAISDRPQSCMTNESGKHLQGRILCPTSA